MAPDRTDPGPRPDGGSDDECPTDDGRPNGGRSDDGHSDGGGHPNGDRCPVWDNAECEGTPHCPPRCPRYFDRTDAPLLVRPLREADVESLVEMYEAVESTTLGLPPATRDRTEQWLSNLREEGWNLVALDGDRVVGHVGVAPADATAPALVVFVRDDYHGRGIGTELVKQAVAYAADRDHEALELTVESGNRRAVSVYTNVGFDVVERAADLEMRLGLDDPVAEAVGLPPAER